jgi:hypothetical protein
MEAGRGRLARGGIQTLAFGEKHGSGGSSLFDIPGGNVSCVLDAAHGGSWRPL